MAQVPAHVPDGRVAAREFVAQLDSGAAFQLEACVHCGQCAEACHFHLVTRDPRYTPVYKLRPMAKAYQRDKAPFSAMRRMLGMAPREADARELEEWSALLYDLALVAEGGTPSDPARFARQVTRLLEEVAR